jgi:hypothetical protein
MANPLVRISDLLDEVAEIFISKAFSENYATPVLYLLHELETRAIVGGVFSADDYERSLKGIRDAIDRRLKQGRWG